MAAVGRPHLPAPWREVQAAPHQRLPERLDLPSLRLRSPAEGADLLLLDAGVVGDQHQRNKREARRLRQSLQISWLMGRRVLRQRRLIGPRPADGVQNVRRLLRGKAAVIIKNKTIVSLVSLRFIGTSLCYLSLVFCGEFIILFYLFFDPVKNPRIDRIKQFFQGVFIAAPENL